MNDCSNHGNFNQNGFCVCEDNYHGGDCSIVVEDLPEHISVKPREWKFYYFNEDQIASFKVEGTPMQLYFKKGSIPGYTNFDTFVEGSEIDLTLDLNDLYVGIYSS